MDQIKGVCGFLIFVALVVFIEEISAIVARFTLDMNTGLLKILHVVVCNKNEISIMTFFPSLSGHSCQCSYGYLLSKWRGCLSLACFTVEQPTIAVQWYI